MLAICDGRPETMGLKRILQECVKFRYEVTTRKYTNLLEKEYQKKEIQEGLIKACDVIDLIIEILRGSKDRAMAKDFSWVSSAKKYEELYDRILGW
jgi:DNA gyrase subunit A